MVEHVTFELFARRPAVRGPARERRTALHRIWDAGEALGEDWQLTDAAREALSIAAQQRGDGPIEVLVRAVYDREVPRGVVFGRLRLFRVDDPNVPDYACEPFALVCERRTLSDSLIWVSVRHSGGVLVQAILVADQSFARRQMGFALDVEQGYGITDIRWYQVSALGIGSDDAEVRAVLAQFGR
jgi:hypothetical protein